MRRVGEVIDAGRNGSDEVARQKRVAYFAPSCGSSPHGTPPRAALRPRQHHMRPGVGSNVQALAKAAEAGGRLASTSQPRFRGGTKEDRHSVCGRRGGPRERNGIARTPWGREEGANPSLLARLSLFNCLLGLTLLLLTSARVREAESMLIMQRPTPSSRSKPAGLWLRGDAGHGRQFPRRASSLPDARGSERATSPARSARTPFCPHPRPNWNATPKIWASAYDAQPDNKQVALAYARALRALTRYQQAVAVAQSSPPNIRKTWTCSAPMARRWPTTAGCGRPKQFCPRPIRPSSRTGRSFRPRERVADQLGDHDQAQSYYSAALKIAPEPAAGSVQPGPLLRPFQAIALRQIHVARGGGPARRRHARAAESRAGLVARRQIRQRRKTLRSRISRPSMPPKTVATIRQMIAQADPWNQIRKLASTNKQAARKPGSISRQRDAKKLDPGPSARAGPRLGAADPGVNRSGAEGA